MRRLLLPAVVVLMAAGPEGGVTVTPVPTVPPPGASSCTGCHVRGGGMGLLIGLPAADTIAAMESFRSGARPATLMNRIAKGFTTDEIVQIALWFEKQ